MIGLFDLLEMRRGLTANQVSETASSLLEQLPNDPRFGSWVGLPMTLRMMINEPHLGIMQSTLDVMITVARRRIRYKRS